MRKTSSGTVRKVPVERTVEGSYSKFSAARSDEANRDYMNRYAEAMDSLTIGPSSTRQVSRSGGTSVPSVAARGAVQTRADVASAAAKTSAQGSTKSRQVTTTRGGIGGSVTATRNRRGSSEEGRGSEGPAREDTIEQRRKGTGSTPEAGGAGKLGCISRGVAGPVLPRAAAKALSEGPFQLSARSGEGESDILGHSWWDGPTDPAGMTVKLTDQPILCMSIWGREAVVGSSDHALYTVDVPSGKPGRTLYGRLGGHTEWVTCVAHTCDGRVVSGGMDGKICLWDRGGGRSQDIMGHAGSVSIVQTSANGALVVSAGYDKTMRLWDVSPGGSRRGSGGRELASLTALSAPVLTLAWGVGGQLMGGCRDGGIFAWDATSSGQVSRYKGAHRGHVTSLAWLGQGTIGAGGFEGGRVGGEGEPPAEGGGIFVSGGQDGMLKAWDLRSARAVADVAAHQNATGAGAVTEIGVCRGSRGRRGSGGRDMVITAGADKTLCVWDPRAWSRPLRTFTDHRDFLYSLHAQGSLVFSGSGDGILLVHDVEQDACLYGLGAISNGAVRCIGIAGHRHLVVAGDDGSVMIYNFA